MAGRYLLSIDGGGIRGIIPVMALVKLERTTGKRAREIFDFVAGTSTGAVITAAIAAGIPAEEVLTLYRERATEIFTKRPWNFLKRIIHGSMYSTEKLYDVICEELGPVRDWQLNDAPIDLLITAKRLQDGMPWYFVRDKPAINSGLTGQLSLAHCTAASAAAPTYFDPWHIPGTEKFGIGEDGVGGAFIDGGVGVAGNPVYQACVEAFHFSTGYVPDETTVISMGTGRFIDQRRPAWLWPWLQWILDELLRSPGEQQTELVQRHFPDSIFYRLDVDLRELDPELKRGIAVDDVENIDRIIRYATNFAEVIDWEAILEGTDTRFRITGHNTKWPQYKVPDLQ